MKPIIYTAFHLNLAFSSIKKEDHATVIKQCYWPLLKLAESGIPIGIELTGFTLQSIQAVDPAWVDTFQALLVSERVELLGSGFVQIIGPLVPPEVSRWNLKLGMDVYQNLLGVRPRIALVNEQAYSPGLLPLYKQAGFEAIMMDWAEPASHHPEWSASLKSSPQWIRGEGGALMPVVWSDTMTFQKFQRYAHGEFALDEYADFLAQQLNNGVRALPLYTSDAEVFDYRPGRFESEAGLEGKRCEWERISTLFSAVQSMPEVVLGLPSEALSQVGDPSGEPLSLESLAVPIPVKKQRKYNILRWAVTGRDDLKLNTLCWRIFRALEAGEATEDQWRQLCLLWASDYRTHITDCRWQAVTEALRTLPGIIPVPVEKGAQSGVGLDALDQLDLPDGVEVTVDRRFLIVQNATGHVVFNIARGLAIQSYGFGRADEPGPAPGAGALIGTLAHGFFDDIALGADFYSGHTVFEPLRGAKVTDLTKVVPIVSFCAELCQLEISAEIETPLGSIFKRYSVDTASNTLTVEQKFDWEFPPQGELHTAIMTFNPSAYNVQDLSFSAHMGGEEEQGHSLSADGELCTVRHSAPISRLVSSTTGVSMTGGQIRLGDKDKGIVLSMNREDCAAIAMLECIPSQDSYFLRVSLSLRETDETALRPAQAALKDLGDPVIRYTITPYGVGCTA